MGHEDPWSCWDTTMVCRSEPQLTITIIKMCGQFYRKSSQFQRLHLVLIGAGPSLTRSSWLCPVSSQTGPQSRLSGPGSGWAPRSATQTHDSWDTACTQRLPLSFRQQVKLSPCCPWSIWARICWAWTTSASSSVNMFRRAVTSVCSSAVRQHFAGRQVKSGTLSEPHASPSQWLLVSPDSPPWCPAETQQC